MAVPPYVTNGDVVDESWGDQVAESLVNPFASTGARSTAWPGATTGATSVLTANSAANGIEIHNGTAWRKPWNLPWGFVGNYAPSSFNFNSAIGYSATFSPTLVQNRLYKLSITGRFENGSVTGVVTTLSLHVNLGSVLIATNLFMVTQGTANGQNAATGTAYYTATSSGALALKLGAISSASATNQQYIATNIIVEDMGPNGVPA